MVYNTRVFPIKQFFRVPIQKFLEALVRIKLARMKPTIIGITGSFGKTTAKEAVYAVLRTKWRVLRNLKSLNTEIGLLLAILEQPSGFRSPLKWLRILLAAKINAFFSRKYDFLVLEYGADKPGDIAHLVKLAKPHVAIVTHIAAVHQAQGQFQNAEAVFHEKKKLVACLGKSDIAILNRDDNFLKKLDGELAAKIFWHGNGGDAYASDLKNTAKGFSAVLHMGNEKIRADFPAAGSFHISAFLPALLCGKLHGVTFAEGVAALQNFKLPPGRMSIIPGIHGTVLLDSSYNASPETMKQALALLKDFPGGRKIAVLGNMNELGDYTEKAHREIGGEIGGWLDELVTVGGAARIIADEALKKGFPESRIKTLSNALEAVEILLSQKLSKGDVILLKGSQNQVRLERTAEKLMAHPEDAKKLLCRQEREWKEIE